jgi:tetratricopeptide (TPR) repeat protein
VKLVDENGTLRWGDRHRSTLGSLFTLEEEVAEEVVRALKIVVSQAEVKQLARRHTENSKAYLAYQQGLNHLWNNQLVIEGSKNAVEYFRLAIEEDPSFAIAYVGLASSYIRLGFFLTSEDYYRRARETARKALEVDDTLAESHQLMGVILTGQKRWAEAEVEFAKARELDPSLRWHVFEVNYLLWMGRWGDAVDAIGDILLHSDPLSGAQQKMVAHLYYSAREYDRSIKFERKYLELGGEDQWYTVLSSQAKGLEEQAFAAALTNLVREETPETIEEYRQAFLKSGMRGYWKLRLVQNDRVRPYDRAGNHALAGNNDQAFELLEEAYKLPLGVPFVAEARFDSLRSDPRFEGLLRKLNLPEEAIRRHLAQ